jgi:hypothetical protein
MCRIKIGIFRDVIQLSKSKHAALTHAPTFHSFALYFTLLSYLGLQVRVHGISEDHGHAPRDVAKLRLGPPQSFERSDLRRNEREWKATSS